MLLGRHASGTRSMLEAPVYAEMHKGQ
jgi:hypothetical protein